MAVRLSELKAQGATIEAASPQKTVKLSEVGGEAQEVKIKPGQNPRDAQIEAILGNIERNETLRKVQLNQKLAPKIRAHTYPLAQEKLESPDFKTEDAINPFIQDLSDTPDSVFGDATPQERAELENKFGNVLYRGGYDVTTGEFREFFDPHGGSPGSNKNKQLIQKELTRLRNPYIVQQAEETSPGEAALISIGRGLNTIGRGVGLVDMPDQAEETGYQLLKGENPAMSAGEVLGEALPFAPAGLGVGAVKSTGGRVVAGSALGATEGAVVAKGLGADDDGVMKSALLGAGIGGVFEGAIPLVNMIARRVSGRVTPDVPLDRLRLDSEGVPTPELQAWLDSQNMTLDDLVSGTSNPLVNAERQRAFEELGVPMTEAERVRSPELFADQAALGAQDTATARMIAGRESQLDMAAQKAIEATGGTSGLGSSSIRDAVVGKADALKREIDDLYNTARQQSGDQKLVRFDSARNTLVQEMPRNKTVNNIVGALRDQMRQMGVLDKNMRPVGRVSVAQAEELRQFANSLRNDAVPGVNSVISKFNNSLDDDVFRAVDNVSPESQQLFVTARRAKANYEQSKSRQALDQFDKSKTSLVNDILENKIKIDTLAESLWRQKSKYQASDLQDLKHYLTTGTPDQIRAGQQAWNNLRADTLEAIKNKAFVGAETAAGTKTLSRPQLDNALKMIGDKKMAVLFSKAERDFIENLRKIAVAKEPPALPPGSKSYGAADVAQRMSSITTPDTNMLIGMLSSALSFRKNRLSEKQLLKLQDDLKNIAAQNRAIRENRLISKTVYKPAQAIMRALPSPSMMELVKPVEETE